VLLDEPLANLDVSLKRELLGAFRALFRERGTTVLYVTHDPREAAALGDRLAILESGRIVQEGTLEELRRSPESPFVKELLETM
jgi:ABC-type sugar transport system ATPase subunit